MAKRIDTSVIVFKLAMCVMLGSTSASAYDWLQFNGDPQHSGNNIAESILGRGTVAALMRKFQVTLPAPAYSRWALD